MGTSQSSSGPPGNVPMVPPWVPSPEDAPPDQNENPDGVKEPPEEYQSPPSKPPEKQPQSPIAPARRLGGARRNLNTFAGTGDKNSMRRGMGQYIRKGYGGSGTALKRFGGTAKTAGVLYNALSSVAKGKASFQDSPLDPKILSGKSAQEVIDAVIEAVSPTNGTQDVEANRASINDALSELLKRDEDADILNLTEEDRVFVIERYIVSDIFRRFELDLGPTIYQNAPSTSSALSRLKEVREYIKGTVNGYFRELKNSGKQINSKNINMTIREALKETFEVFEDYAE